jgi:hypothetical protein
MCRILHPPHGSFCNSILLHICQTARRNLHDCIKKLLQPRAIGIKKTSLLAYEILLGKRQ